VYRLHSPAEVPGKMGSRSTINSQDPNTAKVTELLISDTGLHFSKTVKTANLPRA
jgi:hypothetical protein